MTLPPRAGKRNERFRDLIDLLLMEDLVADGTEGIRDACEVVFQARATHAWPPLLDEAPAHWAEPFARQAHDLGLDVTNVQTAIDRVRAFVARLA